MPRLLTDAEIARQLGEVDGWDRVRSSMRRVVELPSFTTAIAVVNEVALEAEEMDHHPDFDIRWRTVTFTLTTHSEGGLTQFDLELAHRIDSIVREHVD